MPPQILLGLLGQILQFNLHHVSGYLWVWAGLSSNSLLTCVSLSCCPYGSEVFRSCRKQSYGRNCALLCFSSLVPSFPHSISVVPRSPHSSLVIFLRLPDAPSPSAALQSAKSIDVDPLGWGGRRRPLSCIFALFPCTQPSAFPITRSWQIWLSVSLQNTLVSTGGSIARRDRQRESSYTVLSGFFPLSPQIFSCIDRKHPLRIQRAGKCVLSPVNVFPCLSIALTGTVQNDMKLGEGEQGALARSLHCD